MTRVGIVDAIQNVMANNDELKDRVEARRHELLAKYNDLKADARGSSKEARNRIKQRLDELESDLKDGWQSVTDATRTKLSKWLERED